MTNFEIEVCEEGFDYWAVIPAESCVAMWPKQTTKRKTMKMRYAGQLEDTIYFPFTEDFEGFCLIKNSQVSEILRFYQLFFRIFSMSG